MSLSLLNHPGEWMEPDRIAQFYIWGKKVLVGEIIWFAYLCVLTVSEVSIS